MKKLPHNMKVKSPRLLLLLLSFLIPCFILLAAFAGLGVIPFGDNTLMISDGNSLYVNYMAYAGRLFKGMEGVTYSFEKGLGGNMMPHLDGTLLNPFFSLFSIVDIMDYPAAYTWVSVLNISLCGLTMYLLLSDLYGDKRSNLLFSTSYALIGFNVANVFQVIFFAGVAVLPLMALGLRKLFKGQNPILYILSIAYTLATSLYFGFALCVASFLLFVTMLVSQWKELNVNRKATVIRYAVSSIIAGLLVITIWLPAFLGLQGGRLEQTKLGDYSFWENMPTLDIAAKLFTGANNTDELVNGLPNIFVGILPISLVILFFLNRKIEFRHKIAACILLVFYLLSFYIVAFNMLMHGGTSTNWFNYRYSFVFSFLLLLVAAYEWQFIEIITKSDIGICFAGMVIVSVAIFSKIHTFVMAGEALLDFAILFLIYLAYNMFRKNPQKNPLKTCEMIVLILVSVQMLANCEISIHNIMIWGNTASEYQSVIAQVDPLIQGIKDADHSFYRMEINEQRSGTTGNDPMLYGYNGVGHGGSNERNFIREGLSKIGVPWFDMRNFYAQGVPAATDALLGVKYVVAKQNLAEEKGYTECLNLGDWSIYQNPYVLPIAFVSQNALDYLEMGFDNVFDNLNRVWRTISGIEEDVFLEEGAISFEPHHLIAENPIDGMEAREIVRERDASMAQLQSSESDVRGPNSDVGPVNNVVTVPPEESSYICFTLLAMQDGPLYIYNKSGLSEINGAVDPCLKYMGFYHKGDRVVGYLPVNGAYVSDYLLEDVAGRFRAAYVNQKALAYLSENVREQPVVINKLKDNHLIGTFAADQAGQLLFTIPFDAGWTVYLDGNVTDIKQAMGVFLAVDIQEGTHTFELVFTPQGMNLGKTVSIVAFVMLLLYMLVERRWIDRGLNHTADGIRKVG